MSALARLLVDFDAPRAATVTPFASLAPGEPANAAAASEALAAARAAGLEEGRADAAAEAAARLAEQAAEHETRLVSELAQARALWAQAEGEALAARVQAALAHLRDEVEEGVAAVLRPLAETGAAREAARLMAGEIARLLGAGAAPEHGPPLEIAGPADLIDAVRDALDRDPRVGPGPSAQGRIRFVEAEGVDAFARLGRAGVETRLAAFARALRAGA